MDNEDNESSTLARVSEVVLRTVIDLAIFVAVAYWTAIFIMFASFDIWGFDEEALRYGGPIIYVVIGCLFAVVVYRFIRLTRRLFFRIQTQSATSTFGASEKPVYSYNRQNIAEFVIYSIVDVALFVFAGYIVAVVLIFVGSGIWNLSGDPLDYGRPIIVIVVLAALMGVLARCILRARRLFRVPSGTTGEE